MRTIWLPSSRLSISALFTSSATRTAHLRRWVFATRHPELVRTIVLAEPPAVPLLSQLTGDQAATGQALFAEIETTVTQMQAAWRSGDREEGMRIFFSPILP